MTRGNDLECAARAATSRGMRLAASVARAVERDVGRAVAIARRRSSESASSSVDGESEEGQSAALLHYCRGLRTFLSTRARDDAREINARRDEIVRECARLRATIPVRYRSGKLFTSSGALFTAFAFELERARSAEHLAELSNAVVACAEAGLVPYHSARESYSRVRDVLASHADALRALDFARERVEVEEPTEVDRVTPWSLTRNSPALDAKIVAAAMEVQRTGYAIVDGTLGDVSSLAIRRDLEAYADDVSAFTKGELDQSERRVLGDEIVDRIRDDRIAWLSGEEPGLVGAFCQFLRVTLLNPLSLAFSAERPGALAPVDSYISNAMLSVYDPGARGFVSHVDNCGPGAGDPRALSAIYYPSTSSSAEGGALTLFPDHQTRRIDLNPTADRLVLFASARVPHAVQPRATDASRRLAASFWYVGDPMSVGPAQVD